jgi:hypothetical protein
MHGENQKFIQNLIRKHEGKRPLVRTRLRRDDNIKADPKKYGVRLWTASDGSG